jgi:hypothetical protein
MAGEPCKPDLHDSRSVTRKRSAATQLTSPIEIVVDLIVGARPRRDFTMSAMGRVPPVRFWLDGVEGGREL